MPCDALGGEVGRVFSRDVLGRTEQPAGLLSVTSCEVPTPLFILAAVGGVHSQLEPERAAGIPAMTGKILKAKSLILNLRNNSYAGKGTAVSQFVCFTCDRILK